MIKKKRARSPASNEKDIRGVRTKKDEGQQVAGFK
jgi:hypothetical protein